MTRYMKTAAEANVTAKQLFELGTKYLDPCDLGPRTVEQYKKEVATLIGQLVNYGVRCSPRGVQHTVRLNAVREAVKGLPVEVSMKEVTDPDTGRSFNAMSFE